MKLIATRKPEQNVAAVDPWTFVHLAAGLACGLMAIPRRWAFTAGLVYELMEQVFERHDAGQEFFESHGPESLPNALVDTVVLLAGHRLGELWNERI